MSTVSVIIITKNAADDIRRCLASVAWADEIIVLDSGSTDATVAICREYTPHVEVTDWPGFGAQKNRALAKANCDWVLSLDADEWLDAALIDEIQHVLKQPSADAYALPRCSKFCGRFIKHGAWRDDWVTRLFKRGSAKFSNDIVHEKLITVGKVTRLKNWLWHDSCKNLETALQKANSYSTLSAQMKWQQGKRTSLIGAMGHGIWTFLKTYFFRVGFLDGRAGFLLSWTTAAGSYYRYLKLLYLQDQPYDKKNH